jgi:4-hydroxy-4-methyl-2-oxoglutarate aldolase
VKATSMNTQQAEPLDASQIEALKKISTPTIANAIELFDVRPRNAGYLGPEVRCMFPRLGRMVGYAATAVISADLPAASRGFNRAEYWESTSKVPAPRVAVIQDLDSPSGKGSFWGEVHANIHQALGFVGAVTNGSVRDTDEMEALGFHAFARVVSVSHAYVHLVDYGGTVRVGGALIHPGDLLHGDGHGIAIIPYEIAHLVAQAAAEVDDAERELIRYCQKPDFTIEGLKQADARLAARFLELTNARRNRAGAAG